MLSLAEASLRTFFPFIPFDWVYLNRFLECFPLRCNASPLLFVLCMASIAMQLGVVMELQMFSPYGAIHGIPEKKILNIVKLDMVWLRLTGEVDG